MEKERFKFENNKLSVLLSDKWENIEFDGYNFLKIIGEGANGVVLKVQHNITERIDALKIWLPNKKSESGKVSEEQFLREIRKIAKITDPNIVRIYNAKILNDEVCMCAMEYVKGDSLREWIKKSYRIEQRIKICKEILQTVERYQSQGIIHGDLHSGNIIIDDDGHIHIIDFGTSLFGHDNQSKQRESHFIYRLTKEILQEEFNEDFFTIKNYKIYSKIENSDDTRNFSPLLITKTMLHFVEMINIRIDTERMTDKDILVEYCNHIAQGVYFNLDAVSEDLVSWSDLEMLELVFASVLYSSIHAAIFDVDEFNKMEELFYCTLYIYYEMFSELKDKINKRMTKEKYFERYKGYVDSNKYDEYMDILYNLMGGSYIEFRKSLVKEYKEETRQIEECLRGILSNLIEIYFGSKFIYVLYTIWQRINEIRINDELYYKIISMSRILKDNNYL